jgi:hypothetical protein
LSDDPLATAFARWRIDAEEWRVTHAGLSDLEAACDEAGALIGRLRDILIASPLLEMTGVRQKAEAAAAAVNPKWSEEAAGQRRNLMALKRGVLDFGQVSLGPGSTLLAGDLALRGSGSPSLLDDKIPRARSYGGGNPLMKAAIKPQTVRFAHFMAGRNASSWRSEHARICPKLSVDQQNVWNRLLDKAERDDCRRVGRLIRKDAPLSPAYEAIAAAATRWGAAELADMVRAHF